MKQKRFGFVVATLFFLVIIAVVGWVVSHRVTPEAFPIKTVKIYCPCQNITDSLLQETILPFAKKGFFGISLKPLENKLLQLPGVQTVALERQWPSTLVIRLTEKAPIALWGKNELITASADIFPRLENSWANLPLLVASDSQAKKVVTMYLYIHSILNVSGLGPSLAITQLVYTNDGIWHVQINHAFWLILTHKHLTRVLKRFMAAYPMLLEKNPTKKVVRVDLRYANGMAVRFSS